MTTTPQEPGLRLGFVPGVTITKWERIWADRFRRIPLMATPVDESEQRTVLDDGTVDLCFVRLPIETTDLHTIPLYEERPVVWMSKDFLLAALDEVSADDLVGHRIIHDHSPESIDLAVYNAAALRVPLSIARSQSRKDMVHRPVVDAEPTRIALAWRTDNELGLIEEFIGVVRGRSVTSSRTASEREQRRSTDSRPARKGSKGLKGSTAPKRSGLRVRRRGRA